MGYLKHEGDNNKKRPRKPKAKPPEPVQAPPQEPARLQLGNFCGTSIAFDGLSEVGEALTKVYNALRSINVNAYDGDLFFNIGTGTHNSPVRLVLEGKAVDSIADSLKRIADAVTREAK